MKKYGLQLRAPAAPPSSSSSSSSSAAPVKQKLAIFNDADEDEEESMEQALAREAAKKRALKEVELQHKAALEQDSTVFDYDGYYDEMKAKAAPPPRAREKEKPKYITKLVEKARIRKQEQEIVYERKLLKERQREDHLYGDKEKFVTTAYKKKLAELEKWNEEERVRQLREEAEEVTKKDDLSDFYRNLLSKNVAFGAVSKEEKVDKESSPTPPTPQKAIEKSPPTQEPNVDDTRPLHKDDASSTSPDKALVKEPEGSHLEKASARETVTPSVGIVSKEDMAIGSVESTKTDRKPSEDAILAAKERYLARKRMRT